MAGGKLGGEASVPAAGLECAKTAAVQQKKDGGNLVNLLQGNIPPMSSGRAVGNSGDGMHQCTPGRRLRGSCDFCTRRKRKCDGDGVNRCRLVCGQL